MSGAGETKNKGFQTIRNDAPETFASVNSAVRLYWKNGVLWTVYRQEERRGWRPLLSRITDQMRRSGAYLLKWITGR
jgi:hypothetical protein